MLNSLLECNVSLNKGVTKRDKFVVRPGLSLKSYGVEEIDTFLEEMPEDLTSLFQRSKAKSSCISQ